MDDFTRQAAEIALRKMFRPEGYLDITLIKQVLEAARVLAPREELEAVRLLHCVHWKDMPAPVRDEAVRRILRWFAMEPFDPFAALEVRALPPAVPASQPSGFLSRLLGKGHAQ